MNFTLVSFVPATEEHQYGLAIIRVLNCAFPTEVSILFGIEQDSEQFLNILQDAANSVLDAMNPNSKSYDESLIIKE